MEKIILVGGGGHCRVIIDAILLSKNYTIEGIIDKRLDKGCKVAGIEVLGDDDSLQKLYEKGIRKAFISVGSIGDCSARKAIYEKLKAIGFDLPVVIHPNAVVASDVDIEEGTFVAAGAVINTGTEIGKNAIVNTLSSIDHDCKIGNFCHIAPGATLSGEVIVREYTHIGAGATVIQGINIGKDCMVGAGTTVRYDMLTGKKNYGSDEK